MCCITKKRRGEHIVGAGLYDPTRETSLDGAAFKWPGAIPGAAGVAALRAMLLPDVVEPPSKEVESASLRRARCPGQPCQVPRSCFSFDGSYDRCLPGDAASEVVADGYGQQMWPDGASYKGDYRNHFKHGKGRFVWASGAVYDGDFVEGRLEGVGIFRWPDGSSYQGSWKDGRMHGFGTFLWPDGRSYEGEYENDMKSGKGVFRWPDGREYDGHWKDGVQHGSGLFTSANGKCKALEWSAGQRIHRQSKRQ